MPNFISDFFETRGWLGIVQRNPTTGSLSAGGETITGIPAFTWAGKPNADLIAQMGSTERTPERTAMQNMMFGNPVTGVPSMALAETLTATYVR